MWVKVDDGFVEHPKVTCAAHHLGANGTGRVVAVWLEALCYTARNLTDGLVPLAVARRFFTDRRPLDVLDVMALPDVRLMIKTEAGYRFHDFEHYQPSASSVKAKRDRDRARKFQKDSARNPDGIHADSAAIPRGFRADSAAIPERSRARDPVPSKDQDQDQVVPAAPIWTHRQRGAPLIGNHAGCFDAPAACERGLCVPMKLGLQWRQQRVSEPAIRAFVEATLATVPEGPIGDDPFTFWRAAWSAEHGSRAPAKAAQPSGRQRAADVTIATLRRGSQS